MNTPRYVAPLASAFIAVLLTACAPKAEVEKLRAELTTARASFDAAEAKSAERIKLLETELARIKDQSDTLKSDNEKLKADLSAAKQQEAINAKTQSARDELLRALRKVSSLLTTGITYNEFRVAVGELRSTILIVGPSLTENERIGLSEVEKIYTITNDFWAKSIRVAPYSRRPSTPVTDEEKRILLTLSDAALWDDREAVNEIAIQAFLRGCAAASDSYAGKFLQKP